MAEVKKNPNRKFGWGSLFMLLIIGLIIFGVINAIIGSGGSNDELTPDEFLNKLGLIETKIIPVLCSAEFSITFRLLFQVF